MTPGADFAYLAMYREVATGAAPHDVCGRVVNAMLQMTVNQCLEGGPLLYDKVGIALIAGKVGPLIFKIPPALKSARITLLLPNQYQCEECLGVFDKGITDEEAMAKLIEEFGARPDPRIVAVCNKCYDKIVARNRNDPRSIYYGKG